MSRKFMWILCTLMMLSFFSNSAFAWELTLNFENDLTGDITYGNVIIGVDSTASTGDNPPPAPGTTITGKLMAVGGSGDNWKKVIHETGQDEYAWCLAIDPNGEQSQYGDEGNVTVSWNPSGLSGAFEMREGVDGTGSVVVSDMMTTTTYNFSGKTETVFTIHYTPPVGGDTFTLTTTADPAAGGSIALDPAGPTYNSGTEVTVTATANTGYTFDSWTGDYLGNGNPITITMNADKSVTAVFTNGVDTYTLTTAASPTEGGSIALDPAGPTYNSGTEVTVTAEPATGYTFGVWGGDVSDNTNPATITMDADKSVTAYFIEEQTEYTVTFQAGANGSITGTLEQTVAAGGDATEVSAVPDTGYVFSGWTGGYTGTENPLTITGVSSDMTITANFIADDAPVAESGSLEVTRGASADGTLSATGTSLTYSIVTDPTEGTITNFDPDAGTYTYTPTTATYVGTDSFTFKVNDGTEDSNEATVTINISCVKGDVDAMGDVNTDPVEIYDALIVAEYDAGLKAEAELPCFGSANVDGIDGVTIYDALGIAIYVANGTW